MQTRADLIYDVGMFNGDDTAYYLHRGYTVVSIDANPMMIERAHLRFADEVAAGRLTLLNVGISRTPGTALFYVSDKPDWSSFDKAIASREATGFSEVQIPTLPFLEIMATHGVPHYVKIDIEGRDGLCVEGVSDTARPTYISVESECVGADEVLTDEQALALLVLLQKSGYRRFKLLDQSELTPARVPASSAFGMRLLNSLARGRLRLPMLSSLAEPLTDASRIAKNCDYKFLPGSSGPFGDDIPGGWMDFNNARDLYLRLRHDFFSHRRAAYAFWYDWHAAA